MTSIEKSQMAKLIDGKYYDTGETVARWRAKSQVFTLGNCWVRFDPSKEYQEAEKPATTPGKY
jgi:hypothetical protein